jgi:hypothetical protein
MDVPIAIGQPIAVTADGQKDFRIFRILLDLPAQPRHENVDGTFGFRWLGVNRGVD